MIFVFLGVAIPRRLMYNIQRKYCKGDGRMNKTERKAMVRKISCILRAASGRQLESIWRYVKWVVFGEWE
mgnify:CR=1 FL=1